MKKYRVTIPFPVFVTIEVEAGSAEDAEDKAFEEVYLDKYAGNGGHDKLIGVREAHMSIEPGEYPLDEGGFSVEVEEVTE
jgi:hypothetical protein